MTIINAITIDMDRGGSDVEFLANVTLNSFITNDDDDDDDDFIDEDLIDLFEQIDDGNMVAAGSVENSDVVLWVNGTDHSMIIKSVKDAFADYEDDLKHTVFMVEQMLASGPGQKHFDL